MAEMEKNMTLRVANSVIVEPSDQDGFLLTAAPAVLSSSAANADPAGHGADTGGVLTMSEPPEDKSGDDDLSGSNGNDALDGGEGNDSEHGGAGDDHLSGGGGDDALDGGDGNDTLDGGTGADHMAGGAGNDTYVLDDAGDTVTETSGQGVDTVDASVDVTLGANLENVVLTGSSGLKATGNSLANHETGNAGNNQLSGMDGNDQLGGGDGNDQLSGGNGTDSLEGGNGNDQLDGGTGADTMAGGSGNDSYVVDNAADKVTETAGNGVDTVNASVNLTLSDNVENLLLTGSGSLKGTGNALNNAETGNSGANDLNGAGGNDTLAGGGGNDLLNGGSGADVLTGGTGSDTFLLNSLVGSDTLTDFTSLGDKIKFSEGALHIGDGDLLLEGGTVSHAPGDFATTAELVIVEHNINGCLTADSASVAIGRAAHDYNVGQHVIFAVDNGSSSAIFEFTATGHDATVSASELVLLATLDHTAATSLSDYGLGS
jgi:Ca2+-binding RTX toxin-like protein